MKTSDPQRSIPFYTALLQYFESRTIMAARDFVGMTDGTTDFWLIETPPEHKSPR